MARSGPNPQPKRRRPPADDAISVDAVAAWLRQNPDFLAQHPELLFALTPPAENRGRGVVDFQQFMVARQRDELEKLKAGSRDLLAASRNDKATQRAVHKAVLALLSAPTFEQAIGVVTEEWAAMLGVDVVMLGVETAPATAMPSFKNGLRLLAPGDVDSRLGRLQDARIVATLDPPDADAFGEAAGLARSVVWLRLSIHPNVPPGLLALAARQPEHFRLRENTELFRFLAATLAVTIRAWLDLPEGTGVEITSPFSR